MKYALAIAAGLATIAAAAVYVYTRDNTEPAEGPDERTEAHSEDVADTAV